MYGVAAMREVLVDFIAPLLHALLEAVAAPRDLLR